MPFGGIRDGFLTRTGILGPSLSAKGSRHMRCKRGRKYIVWSLTIFKAGKNDLSAVHTSLFIHTKVPSTSSRILHVLLNSQLHTPTYKLS